MRAAVFADVGVLSIEERPEPKIVADDDVLVRVAACGVCGTDVHILDDPPGHPATTGIVLGHEFVGDVVAIGPEVTAVELGRRVAVRPIITCGACSHCLSGFPNHCADLDPLGVYRDGGLADFAVVPQTACIPIDPSIPAHIAALIEPLACVFNAVRRAAPLPGETVVVFGAGPIGLLFTAVLGSAGVGKIVVVEPAHRRRQVAELLGASATIDPSDTALDTAVQRHFPEGPNLVIDTVGSQLGSAVTIAARRGRIVLFGMNSLAHPVVQQFAITEKELSILGSFVGQHSFPEAIRLLESGTLDLGPVVSHVVELEDLPAALDLARRGKAVKVVVMPGDSAGS